MTTLNELFEHALFRIPDYQRGYSWGDDQRRDIWEDIANLRAGEDRMHYTGALTLRRIGPEMFPVDSPERAALVAHPRMNAYEVVDGRQRLTTVIILAKEFMSAFLARGMSEIDFGETFARLRQRFVWREDEGGGYPLLDYVNDPGVSRYFRCAILGVESGEELQYVETSYSLNLANAVKFFKRQIDALIDARGIDEAQRMFSNLVGGLGFNLTFLADGCDVGTALESMNNRGRPLSNLDRLKGRLLYLVELFDETQLNAPQKAQLRRDINSSWHTIYACLGQHPQKVLDDNEFLRAHWIAYFLFSSPRSYDYMRFLLDAQFASRRITGERVHHAVVVKNPEVERVVDEPMDEDGHAECCLPLIEALTPETLLSYEHSLTYFVRWWQASYFPQICPGLNEEVKVATARLNDIGIGYFRPLVAAALMRAAEGDAGDLQSLLTRIEKFIVKVFRQGTARSSFGEREFCSVTRQLFKGYLTIGQLLEWPGWRELVIRHAAEQSRNRA